MNYDTHLKVKGCKWAVVSNDNSQIPPKPKKKKKITT